jgi:hypothetical protein
VRQYFRAVFVQLKQRSAENLRRSFVGDEPSSSRTQSEVASRIIVGSYSSLHACDEARGDLG